VEQLYLNILCIMYNILLLRYAVAVLRFRFYNDIDVGIQYYYIQLLEITIKYCSVIFLS